MTTWRSINISTFVLGCAQLGLEYGIANVVGQPGNSEAREIVAEALRGGVSMFDTAHVYGNSEQILGDALAQSGASDRAEVCTKLQPDALLSAEKCLDTMQESLRNLRRDSVFAVLAHSFESFSQFPKQTLICFDSLKKHGICSFTGVSVYNGMEACEALAAQHVDIVQMPLNALDHQAIDSGAIRTAKESNKLLMFRSAYLQGLLTMPTEQLPAYMAFAKPILSEWHDLCAQWKIPPREAALAIAVALAEDYPLVIGCETVQQIRDNIKLLASVKPCTPAMLEACRDLASRTPERLRNPSLWKPAVQHA